MESLENMIGLCSDELKTALQMAAKALVIFLISLILIRVAGIRTLGKQTAFDQLTVLMLGAIMGRAIVTTQSFFGSIIAALVLVLLHRLMAIITFRSKRIGSIIKGKQILLFKEGKKQEENLKKTHITEEDILEALRQNTNAASLEKIKEVYLERSGEISLIKE
jgi:uncharacterized membrane protein YcaP (DUF421 family)